MCYDFFTLQRQLKSLYLTNKILHFKLSKYVTLATVAHDVNKKRETQSASWKNWHQWILILFKE